MQPTCLDIFRGFLTAKALQKQEYQQKTEETQFADNGENQIAEIWLQSYLAHQKGDKEESKV